MGQDTCRLPTCNDPPEEDSRYCSTFHEVKYEHIEADARDAMRAEQEERRAEVPDSDLPERDGPPY